MSLGTGVSAGNQGLSIGTGVQDGRLNVNTGQFSTDNRINRMPLDATNNNAPFQPGGLTQIELKRLASHDVVLIIDQSGSMLAPDCPPPKGSPGASLPFIPLLMGHPILGISRWDWCLYQTLDLSRQTQQIFGGGITVVLFSSAYRVFPNVTLDQLPAIFSQNRPMGGTELARPLADQIGAYFNRRDYFKGNIKPLLISIVTDGCPQHKDMVRASIIDATRLMRNPEEISIVFFLIGGYDPEGQAFVDSLTHYLTNDGAAYPVVKAVSFADLRKVGLAKALADTLH